jgi:hypothetical protein
MIIGILQPGYLPWLGFFEQVHRCDVFVIYDDVQYDKHGWRNRNRIKTANGVQWLTVPVHADIDEGRLVREAKIDNRTNWRKKHLMSIKQSYAKAACFKEYIGVFEDAFAREWELILDLDLFFIRKFLEILGMGDKRLELASTLNVDGDKVTRLINICKMFGADTMYNGAAGRSYMDEVLFRENGVNLVFQDYKHPVYTQLHGEFVPYLSVVDVLLNHGGASLEIIKSGG